MKLKMFQLRMFQPTDRVKHSDGRRAAQCKAATLATSKKAAAAAFRVSVGELTNFGGSVGPSWVEYPAVMELLDGQPPGTVVLAGMSWSDTVDGSTGWVYANPCTSIPPAPLGPGEFR